MELWSLGWGVWYEGGEIRREDRGTSAIGKDTTQGLTLSFFSSSCRLCTGLVVDLGDVRVQLVDKDGVHNIDIGAY